MLGSHPVSLTERYGTRGPVYFRKDFDGLYEGCSLTRALSTNSIVHEGMVQLLSLSLVLDCAHRRQTSQSKFVVHPMEFSQVVVFWQPWLVTADAMTVAYLLRPLSVREKKIERVENALHRVIFQRSFAQSIVRLQGIVTHHFIQSE